jgi:hypothetical protein
MVVGSYLREIARGFLAGHPHTEKVFLREIFECLPLSQFGVDGSIIDRSVFSSTNSQPMAVNAP